MAVSVDIQDSHSITREGYDRLRAELAQLCREGREAVAAALRDARDDGADLSDNAGLAAAVEEQQLLERRIATLEATLAQVRVVDAADDGTAALGARVRVRCEDGREVEYRLVGAAEADVAGGRLSIASPVGRALRGRRPGETAHVETPRGSRALEILAVEC